MDKHTTNNGKSGGTLIGKPHTQGGIKAVVTDDNNRPVELEGGEAIITKRAVKKHHKILSKINQDGGGVPIVAPGSAERVDEHAHGGTITTAKGDEVKIGDEVWLKTRWVTIRNITDKWVIFTDQNDGKRKDNPLETFKKNAGELRRDTDATQAANTAIDQISSNQPTIVTDPAEKQKLTNAINEGELILRAGTSNGRKKTPGELQMILRSVNNAREKLGLSPSTAYTPKPDDSKTTPTSSKFAVGEWVGVVDTSLKVTEVRKIAKAEKSSIPGSWSYKFEKPQGGIEMSGVGQKWICSVKQPKFAIYQVVLDTSNNVPYLITGVRNYLNNNNTFTFGYDVFDLESQSVPSFSIKEDNLQAIALPKFSIGQTVEVVSSPNSQYNGTIHEIAGLVYTVGVNQGWSYKTTTNSHWSEKFLKAISSAPATKKAQFKIGQKVKVVKSVDPKYIGKVFTIAKSEFRPDESKWSYKTDNEREEEWWSESNLALVGFPSSTKSKFFKGDIVRVFGRSGTTEYIVTDAEYLPDLQYWVYKVIDKDFEGKGAIEYEYKEIDLGLVRKAHKAKDKEPSMPLAKKHAAKNEPQKQPLQVSFDTQSALDKWVTKNLENKFDVTLKKRTDVALLQLSNLPEAKPMVNELNEMRKNLNKYVPDETGN
jgi:hypothetical protein